MDSIKSILKKFAVLTVITINNKENHALGYWLRLFVKTMRILIKNIRKEINQRCGYFQIFSYKFNILISKQRLVTFSSYLIFNWLENDEKKY